MLLTSALLSSLALIGSPDGCASSITAAAAEKGHTIVETAISNDAFSTLVAAVKAADLVETLGGKGPFTVFAPTNDAFAKLPKEQLAQLLEPKNKELLRSILTYHVVPGKVMAKDVVKLNFATTANGQRIDIETTDAGVMVDGAKVVTTDIKCSNGVIHIIDSVILPSTSDVVATAVDAGSFKTLAAALKAAGLVEALQGDGPVTVFAPTDDAFAALPAGTVESLLKPENRAKLTSILKFHVVSGRVFANDVLAGHELKTLQGTKLTARLEGKKAFVNGAQIVKTDIDASNGVIHVIDSVLIPQ